MLDPRVTDSNEETVAANLSVAVTSYYTGQQSLSTINMEKPEKVGEVRALPVSGFTIVGEQSRDGVKRARPLRFGGFIVANN